MVFLSGTAPAQQRARWAIQPSEHGGQIRPSENFVEVFVMNWDQVQGNWKQFKGKVKEQWGKLTDDQLLAADDGTGRGGTRTVLRALHLR